jgi:peptide/nickel transport system permease protein
MAAAEAAARGVTSGLRSLGQSRAMLASLGLVAVILAFSFLGPLVYHTNQVTVDLGQAAEPPGPGHPLGTDASGYDVLGRLMLGGQSSLELGLAVSAATMIVGTVYGAIAGYAGGFVDAVMMRVVDTFLAVPGLVFLLVMVNLFTPNVWVIIALLTMLSWLATSRLVRGEVLTLRTSQYVQAVRAMGGTRRRIVFRHLLPNAAGVIVVNATFTIADAILTYAALSFLGLGLPPPHADWGTMLSDGLNYLFDGYWWIVYPPAIVLIITVVSFNLVGDAVRDALDVRLRRRLGVHDVGVVAEVHPGRSHRPDAPDRGLPGRPVVGLAGRQLLVQRAGVLARRVGGVPDQQVERAVAGPRHDGLVADRVARGRDHRQAGQDLGVAVKQLEPRAREVEPAGQVGRLAAGALEFGPLDTKRGVPEHRILAAVVEVQVGVDHQGDVGGGHVQLGQGVGHRDVDHAPVIKQVLRAAHAGVDQDRAARMGDHEAVHRPLPPVAGRAQPGQVQPLDLQRHRRASCVRVR